MGNSKVRGLTKSRKSPEYQPTDGAAIYRRMGELFLASMAADSARQYTLSTAITAQLYALETVMMETPAANLESAVRQLQVCTAILHNAGGADNFAFSEAFFRQMLTALVGTLRHALPMFPQVAGEPNYGVEHIGEATGPFANFDKLAAAMNGGGAK